MAENESNHLPPRPSTAGADLRCLGRFWRGQPGSVTHIIEFWLPAGRDLGRPVAGSWAAGLFDGATADEALATFWHHFQHAEAPAILHGEFERAGQLLRRIERDQAA